MSGKPVIKAAVLVENAALIDRVKRILLKNAGPVDIPVVDFLEDAQVVVTDYLDPMQSAPLPEKVNQSRGKPLVVISSKPDHSTTRQLFLEGATDVILLNELEDRLVIAIRRALESRSPDGHRVQLLNTGLVYFRELSEMAGAGTDLNTFFERIVEVVAEIMDVQIVSLMLLNARFQTLWIAAARGLDDKIIRATSVSVGEGISGQVAATGRPLLVQDIEAEPAFAVIHSRPRYNTKGLLSVPIRARNSVIGVVNVNNKTSGFPFEESDLNVLIMLSNQAGLTIDNARLFADLQSKAESLEKAYHQLKRLNRAKTDLIVNLSHEIKTPLTAIIGYVDLLLAGQIDDREKMIQSLEKISLRGRHLNRLAERIITFFALQTKSVQWVREMVPLTTIVYSAVDRLRDLAKKCNVDIFVDGPSLAYDIYCDISHMQEVFLNLIENSIGFNKPGGKVTIYGNAVPEGARSIQVSVADTGSGVSDTIAAKIFDGFVQTDNMMSNKPEGLGIGLAMSHAIVEAHEGALQLTKNSKDGATFSVTLPLK